MSTAAAALDALALLDLAWHDPDGKQTPPEQVIEDIWIVSNGDLLNDSLGDDELLG